MKRAGIREARQNISQLLREVREGREIMLTDRGIPVALLLPPPRGSAKPFRSHRRFRANIRVRGPALSEAISADREDRI